MARPKGSKNKTRVNITGAYTQGGMMSAGNLFSVGSSGAGINKTANGNFNVSQTSSFFYSPELTTESWLLPKSRQEILKWARIFFNLEPYVQSIITMHAMYPFSKFEILTSDKSVTKFYKQMSFNENFDLFKFILDASLSYNKFGEAIPFGNMEQGKDGLWRWKNFILLEPELVEIKSDLFSGQLTFELIPTEELRALVKSERAEDAERKKKLFEDAPEVVRAVEEGRNIQLSEENVSIIVRKTDPSAIRGTSPIQCLFKVLIYQDWIRLAQSAFAQRYIFPVELWTIGDLEKNIIPTEDELTKFRNLINQAIQNPPFSMVFPPIVKYEALSTLGKQFPINNEYDYIHDQLMVGLGVNKNLILGEGPSFSNLKAMALHRLMMMYKVIRDEFENWMINKYFRPIAIKNNFYATVDGQKEPILPQFSWFKSLDIEEEEAERAAMIDMHEKGYVSTETLFSKFPALDFAREQKRLEKEIGTVWDKGDGSRLPKKLGKRPLSKGPGGSGGGSGGGGGSMTGIEPIEPMEPTEPGEEGAEAPMGNEAPGTPPTNVVPATPSATPGATPTPAPTV